MRACLGVQGGVATPLDSMDEICKQHDICYGALIPSEAACDEALVLRLKNLDADPRKWANPPRANTEDQASRYRYRAISLFGKQ